MNFESFSPLVGYLLVAHSVVLFRGTKPVGLKQIAVYLLSIEALTVKQTVEVHSKRLQYVVVMGIVLYF
jgi:hypothetical protein